MQSISTIGKRCVASNLSRQNIVAAPTLRLLSTQDNKEETKQKIDFGYKKVDYDDKQ